MTLGPRLLLLWFFLPIQIATATEYRRLVLDDGSVVMAEIIGNRGTTMDLRVPQGLRNVDVRRVQSIEEISETEYLEQPPWRFMTLPVNTSEAALDPMGDVYQQLVQDILSRMNGIEVIPYEQLQAHLGSDELEDCSDDLGCWISRVSPMGIDWVVQPTISTSDIADSNSYRLNASRAHSPDTLVEGDFDYQGTNGFSERLVGEILSLIDIDQLDDEISIDDPVLRAESIRTELSTNVERRSPSTRPSPSQEVLAVTAFIPVPGMPALVDLNLRNFGLAWGVVVPTTVAMVALVGHSTFKPIQFNILSVLSYYAITVGANRRFGLATERLPEEVSSRR